MDKITFNQYRNSVPGVFRPGDPKCPFVAAIPTLTVTSIEGLKGLADCLVHVTDNNTTYYIDDKHRITMTWSGPLELPNYDYEANPRKLRSQEVWDFEKHRVILYDATGNYAVFTGDIDEFNELKNRPKYGGVEMTSATDIPNVTLIENALQGQIDGLSQGLRDEASAREAIETAIDKVVMTDLQLDSNASTSVVQLDSTKSNIKTSVTTTENIPLPVASSTQAGVMNSATFDAIGQNTANINALSSGAVALTGISATPTQSDLTTAWETETGISGAINRASIYDVDNDKVWTYYTNTSTWYPASNTAQVTINTFTNNAEGTIKGSTNIGQVFAESDGTGSVNGWDALSATVANHTSALGSLSPVATSGSYLDLTDTPTNVSAFTNDAGYLTEVASSDITNEAVTFEKLDPLTVEAGEIYYEWTASAADATTSRIQLNIPLDFIKYRKIIVEAAWEPTGAATSSPDWSHWRILSTDEDVEGDTDALETTQVGTEWDRGTSNAIVRNAHQVIASGVSPSQSEHVHAEFYSAKPGVNWITFFAYGFGGDPANSANLAGGAQTVQGRVNASVANVNFLKIPVYYPNEGSWIRAYGIPR